MYRICLINMPFASLDMPSIALSQVEAVTKASSPEKVSVDVIYLNHDFAKFLGVSPYQNVSSSLQALHAGLGDWFFRQEAFPELPDNTDKYLRRFFWGNAAAVQQIKTLVQQKRPKLNAFMNELISRYELDKADIVGFTSMFMQNAACFAFARILKQRNPGVITIMGGANCEFPMGRVIAENVRNIDFVFSGPALKTFPDFVQHCMEGDLLKCRSIRGVLWKGSPPPQSPVEAMGEELSIDTPIALDYESFMRRFQAYFGDYGFKPTLPVETSRGCWWGQRSHCTFCGLNGASLAYRSMQPHLAIQQFKSLFLYAGRVSSLQAVDNILPRNYLTEVLPFLETPRDIKIFYEVRADLAEQDMAALVNAGVSVIQPGIESLATSTLKLMKKGTTAFQNVSFLKNCRLHGIKPFWNLLVGFPGETAEVYQRYLEIIPLLIHLEPPSGVYPVRFDRFSPFYDQPQSYGLDLHPMDFYSLIYPFREDELEDFAYYFSDRNLQAEYVETTTAWIHKLRADVGRWHARWADSKQGLPPRLHFKSDSDIVYDSRSGSVIEHSVGQAGKAILNLLARPLREEELIKTFSAEYGPNLAEHIALLEGKGLIFREGDRLLSLVMNGEHGRHLPKLLHRDASSFQPSCA